MTQSYDLSGGSPLLGLRFFALLFIPVQRGSGDTPNLRISATARDAQANIYVKMAARLARGINRVFGGRLTVVTNSPDLLHRLQEANCKTDDEHFEIESIPFPNQFPPGARFQSASQKTALYSYLSTQPGYSIALDLDMLCLRAFDDSIEAIIRAGRPLVYDISDQVIPAYSYDRISQDLSNLGEGAVNDRRLPYRWFGGEFLGGTENFFLRISLRMESLITRYLDIWETLHHQGDEIMTTTILNEWIEEGSADFVDVAISNTVRRFWGIATKHLENPLHQDQLSFLHLPAKKGLLISRLSDSTVSRLVKQRFLSSVLSRVYIKYG